MTQLNCFPRLAIIGGAGPMAGVTLFRQIINICQETYCCRKDADFPYMLLMNYPFVDMLNEANSDRVKLIQNQVEECFMGLDKNEINIAAIACNTLHAFLSPGMSINRCLVHMIAETAAFIKTSDINETFVLCTKTSAQYQLHKRYFNCDYPDIDFQIYVDELINKVMAGSQSCQDAQKMAGQINAQINSLGYLGKKIGVVLGCTELTVFYEQFPLRLFGLDDRVVVLDPSQIVAEKICKLIFNKN